MSPPPPNNQPTSTTPPDNQPGAPGARRRIRAEILIVLGLSLGASAVYATLALADRLTAAVPLAQQTASLNTSDSPKPWLDLLYQLAGIAFALVPVALALYLLAGAAPSQGKPALGRAGVLAPGAAKLGLTLTQPLRDLGWAAVLAGGIGLPGIGLYLAGRGLGITAHISTASLGAYWWTVPVLVLAAAKNGLLEEVIAVGYLGRRLADLGWAPPVWIAASAALRGSYHLYQGIGPFLGNAVMGAVFAWFYHRRGRVMPLVAAHTLIDVVAFVGPSLVNPAWLT
ncbi:MAG: CPBP family intramembrane metalloprotease [Bifidobacteriaceae bacterium]|nr:CPBP family intramembrane metalloprotease [Bifidobacteriaceae bacterium]